MLISVIIPCYNSEFTVIETLESLENNDSNLFEVLVINDGSKDLTEDVVIKYMKTSKMSIKIIRQENKGVSAARNNGIDNASGKYIIFLDSDDLLASNYINAISALAESDEYDTIACYRTSDINKVKPVLSLDNHIINSSPLHLMERYTYSKDKLGFTSFAFKRNIIKEFGLQFKVGAKYGEDFEFVTKYLAHCSTAVEVDYYYYYRIVANSVSRTTSYSQVDAINSAERAADYLDGINHPFAKRFREFMYNRAIFSVAHRFSKGCRKDLFNRFIKEYPVKKAMTEVFRDSKSGIKPKLAAGAYLISPNLFYLLAKY